MKKLLICRNNLGAKKIYLCTYPKDWTEEKIRQHFDRTTFGYYLDDVISAEKIEEVFVNDMDSFAQKVGPTL